MIERAFGRRVPSDWAHVERYPLTEHAMPQKPVPVVAGFDWHADFDQPVQKGGRFWIGLDPKNLRPVRAGHAVCLEPGLLRDTPRYRRFYLQGDREGCAGCSVSRMMTLLNGGQLYDWLWLWEQAKLVDGDPSTNLGDNNGTTVRAACEVLRTRGHVPWDASYAARGPQERATEVPVLQDGVETVRWATSVDDVIRALRNPEGTRLGAVCVLNSWANYPQRVWMPGETLEALRNRNAELALVTER